MKRLFLLVFILFTLYESYAQQEAQYTQYMYNMNIINPAYAGSKENTISIGLMSRAQWLNIPGAPKTATLSVHKPFKNGLGAGISVISDAIGPINEQYAFADISYTIPVGYYEYLSFGLKAGMTLMDAKLIDVETFLPNDDNFSQNIHSFKPNIGFGLFFHSDNYYAGLSMPNLLKTEYLKEEGGVYTSINRSNHIYLTGGYVYDINYYLKFKPHMMIKAAIGSPLSVDFSANFLYNERFEGGLSYRWNDSISGLVNFQITDFLKVGYAYDYTVSDLRKYNTGTHELFIQFDIFSNLVILSPRFF